ncbi:hypothetical protein N9B14_08060, partial [Akkermansiaceae bacterium]|nr:hypothetical protein [Akkermansiaceae bacterium]
QVADTLGNMTGALPLLDCLFEQPAITASHAKEQLSISFTQANRILSRFEEIGLVKEITGQKRNRRFRNDPYLNLFRPPESSPSENISDTTQA